MATVPIDRPSRHNDDFDKPLPHNLEAERAILGAIILDETNGAFETAIKHVRADDFFLPQHRVILRAMAELAKVGSAIDTQLLNELLISKAQIEAAGGLAYLLQLTDSLPRITNVPHYCAILTKKAALRRMIHEANDIQRRALEPDADLAALSKQLAAASTQRITATDNGHKMDYSLLEFLAEQFPVPEHLIEGLIPRGGSAMIVAMPHHLKSWFTLGITLGSTVAGTIMGRLEVKKPVRTYYVPIEDYPGEVQWRIKQLTSSGTFTDFDPALVRVLPRPPGGFDIMDEAYFQRLLGRIQEFKAEHVILDVLRRVFRGDINSPKESAALCEQLDRLRDITGAAVTIVHHENRKEADIMRASAGSYNLPGWANVVIQFKRKMQEGATSRVEIEVDNKLAQSPEPMSMILDFAAAAALRLEALEDSAGVTELRERLGQEWTVRDMAEALDVHKANAYRRLKKLLAAGVIEKVGKGKRGQKGGLARYCFLDDTSTPDD